jgi:hypothetical protein
MACSPRFTLLSWLSVYSTGMLRLPGSLRIRALSVTVCLAAERRPDEVRLRGGDGGSSRGQLPAPTTGSEGTDIGV